MEQNDRDGDPGAVAPPDPRRDARAAVLHLAGRRAALGDALVRGGVEEFAERLRCALQGQFDPDLADPEASARCARALACAALDSSDPELRAALLGPGGGLLGAVLDRLAPGAVRADQVAPHEGWQLVELERALGVEVQDAGAPGVAAALAACALASAPTGREDELRSVLVEAAAALGIESPADTLDRRGPRGLLDRCLLAAGHLAGQAQRHRDEGARALAREVLGWPVDLREDRSPADLLRDEIREARATDPRGRRALAELERVAERILSGVQRDLSSPEQVAALGGAVLGRASELQSSLVEIARSVGYGDAAPALVRDDLRRLVETCASAARAPGSGDVWHWRARAEAAEAQLASARAAAGLPESGGDLALAVASLVESGIAGEDRARAEGARALAREVLNVDELEGDPADALRDALDRVREGAVARSVSESEPSAWRGAALQLAADLEVRVAGDADPPDLLRALVLGVVGEAARCVSDAWPALGLPVDANPGDLARHVSTLREDLASAARALGADDLEGAGALELAREVCGRVARVVDHLVAAGAALGSPGMGGASALTAAAHVRRVVEERASGSAAPSASQRAPFNVGRARGLLSALHGNLSGSPASGKFDVERDLERAVEDVGALRRRLVKLAGCFHDEHAVEAARALEALVPAGALAEPVAMAETGWLRPEVASATRGHLLDLVAALNARGASTEHHGLELDALAERALDHVRLRLRAEADDPRLVLGLPRDQADALCRALVGTAFDGPDAARETVVSGVAMARADLLAALDALSPGDADAWAHAGVDALSRRVRGLADGSARPCWDGTDLGDAVQVLARAVGLADAERGSGAEAVRRLAGEVERARRDLEASAEALDLDLPASTLPGAAAHLRARAQDLRDALLRLLELAGAAPAPDGVRVEHALEDELRGQAGTLGEVLAQLGDEDSLEYCALRDVVARVLSRAHDHGAVRAWATRAQAALQRLDLRLAEESPGLAIAPDRGTCARETPTAEDLLRDDREGLDAALRALDGREKDAEHDFDLLDELLPDGWDLRRLLLDVLVPHAADEPAARRESLTSEEFCERLVLAYEDQLRGPGSYAEVGPVARRDRALALGAALELVLD